LKIWLLAKRSAEFVGSSDALVANRSNIGIGQRAIVRL
jgi:hypothetical protein